MKKEKFKLTKFFLDNIKRSRNKMYYYMNKLEHINEIDKCVNCGCETPYFINIHIDLRNYYVKGAGQLCKDCYDKIYN